MRFTTLLFLLACAGAAHGADTIQRCVAADGGTVYTDKPCDQLGARPLVPPAPTRDPESSVIDRRAPGTPSSNAGGAVSLGAGGRSDCVRRTDTLLYELRGSIESQNVNRLASVYDWAGKSSRAATGIIERLTRITSRPLASVEFVFPEPDPYADLSETPPPAAPPAPIGVHIEQLTLGDTTPIFEEDLRLVRNADCWWVSF